MVAICANSMLKKKFKSQIKLVKKVLVCVICIVLCGLLAMAGALAYFAVKYPLSYKTEITKYSKEFGLQQEFVASLINAESGFVANRVSNAGAIGLMQIMPQTAKFVAQELNEKNFDESMLFCPQTNIRFGCFYLSYLQKKFSDKFTLLCAYNAGEGKVFSWLSAKKYSHDAKALTSCPYSQTTFYAQKVISGQKIYAFRF